MPHKRLFIPGPTEVRPENLLALATPQIGHRGDEFKALYSRVQDKLAQMLQTRAPVYLFTSSSTVSTLEFSSEPCWVRPSPLLNGWPCCGVPLAAVSRNRLEPIACSPDGLMKSVSCSCPSWVGEAWPNMVASTMPSSLMVMFCASAGTVMPGCSVRPWAVTISPSGVRETSTPSSSRTRVRRCKTPLLPNDTSAKVSISISADGS